jgi:dTDP-4-dehydrorhamnose 3,5-epimerase
VETPLPGAYVIEAEPARDERGSFARTFCRREFESQGLDPRVAQCSVSFNRQKGTLRGLHLQVSPHRENKLVACVQGALYDVILDLRPDRPTFCRWHAVTLSGGSWRMVYVPEGVAHGFLTLEDSTVVSYQISEPHQPGAARGVRWDDRAFGIVWPAAPVVMSPRDASWPAFDRLAWKG